MTRGQKRLLVVLGVIVLSGAAFAWYWQAMAVDRQVNALLHEVRGTKPGLLETWLMKLGLAKNRRTHRSLCDVPDDLARRPSHRQRPRALAV